MSKKSQVQTKTFDEDEDLQSGQSAEEQKEHVDLTAEQTQLGEQGGDDMNEYDLLDATIDPDDYYTVQKVNRLERTIQYEKARIAMKQAFKWSNTVEDPMRI